MFLGGVGGLKIKRRQDVARHSTKEKLPLRDSPAGRASVYVDIFILSPCQGVFFCKNCIFFIKFVVFVQICVIDTIKKEKTQ